MNNLERRDMQMPYVADEEVLQEMQRCREILQRLNHGDCGDFNDIEKANLRFLISIEEEYGYR